MTTTAFRPRIAPIVALFLIAALTIVGPIAQPHSYHAFADQRAMLSIANAGDVLSNLAFLLVAWFGFSQLQRAAPEDPALPAYAVFFAAIGLTALGSTWYHLAPDNARLVWDRMPIAGACAALLAASIRDTYREQRWARLALPVLVGCAILSVLWWAGTGDLRFYLLIQAAPLVLIPILQWQARAPITQRTAFFIAIVLYVWAKLFEVADEAVFAELGFISGHTIKHLLAAAAALVLARQFAQRQAAGAVPGA